MTTTEAETTSNRPDKQAAGIYRALALRALTRYSDFRESAEFYGQPMADLGELPAMSDVYAWYADAVQTWVFEPCGTATAATALIEFAGLLAAEQIRDGYGYGGPIATEKDNLHQVVALAAVINWLRPQTYEEALPQQRKPAAGGRR